MLIAIILIGAYVIFWLVIWLHDRVKDAQHLQWCDQHRPGPKPSRSFRSYLWEAITGKIVSPPSPHDDDISRRFF